MEGQSSNYNSSFANSSSFCGSQQSCKSLSSTCQMLRIRAPPHHVCLLPKPIDIGVPHSAWEWQVLSHCAKSWWSAEGCFPPHWKALVLGDGTALAWRDPVIEHLSNHKFDCCCKYLAVVGKFPSQSVLRSASLDARAANLEHLEILYLGRKLMLPRWLICNMICLILQIGLWNRSWLRIWFYAVAGLFFVGISPTSLHSKVCR